jgi:hypothetical protein
MNKFSRNVVHRRPRLPFTYNKSKRVKISSNKILRWILSKQVVVRVLGVWAVRSHSYDITTIDFSCVI